MAKTKFEIELTGLKIKFEGEREEMPSFSNAVANQVGQLLTTPTVTEQASLPAPKPETDSQIIEAKPKSLRKSRAKKASSDGASRPGRKKEPAVDWKHDPDKWGNPLQNWNPTKKSIWLLYILENLANVKMLTSSGIANTFNKHFKETGQIQTGNVTRDLRKAKKAVPALVHNDSTEKGEPWYLLEAGKKIAEQLVLEARGIPTGE